MSVVELRQHDGGPLPASASAPPSSSSPTSPPTVAAPADGDPVERLDAIARWIGTPAGRGRIVAAAPAFGCRQPIRTFDADGELRTRHVTITRLLGSGLAGTVYLAEGDAGETFVEKHFGDVPAGHAKRLGRALAGATFALFRQAPLSFRELSDAVVASHLANRFVVALSAERFEQVITPPLRYTRYDERTGGYVQAFAFVPGRPLRPFDGGDGGSPLPLLGEPAAHLRTMRMWRDFLADELGFWGLARQVDPANPNAFGNLWVQPDGQLVLLDIVPGVPGFLEPRYIWWGLTRGQFPPFGDAIDFARLERALSRHPLSPADGWRRDLETLRAAVARWQASEPRWCASPVRPWRVLTDPYVKRHTRAALLTHIEVKGAITREQATAYRAQFGATGRFPKLVRHAVLKMSPRPVHRFLTDGRYAWRKLLESWRWPFRAARWVGRNVKRLVLVAWQRVCFVAVMLASARKRRELCRAEVNRWVDEAQRLGRVTETAAVELRQSLESHTIADAAGLFVLHLLLGGVKQSLVGPSVLWLGVAVATQSLVWLIPLMVGPTLRVIAVIWVGLWRHPGLLAFAGMPVVGNLAAPLFMLRHRSRLGDFLIRGLAQGTALRIPAFGERGSMTEALAVAVAQVCLIDLGRVLPVLVVIGLVGLAFDVYVVPIIAAATYVVAVACVAIKRWRAPRVPRETETTAPSPPDAPPAAALALVPSPGTPGEG